MSDVIKIRIPWWKRMLLEPTVMLDNLVLSVSDSVDLIHPLWLPAIFMTLARSPSPERHPQQARELDPEEFDVIRAHTYHTYHILSTIGGFEEIAIWAAFHHERLDGKGYPFHVKGEDIPLGSRIMCVADVFTAVTENRPYRKGTGRNETLPILQNLARSGALDDNVVGVLTENYDEIDRTRSDAQEISASEYSDFVRQKTGAGRSLSRI